MIHATIPKIAERLTDGNKDVRRGALDALKAFGMQSERIIVAIHAI